jgi:hypothetical protein
LSPSSKYFSNVSWQGNISSNIENPTGDNALNVQVGLGKTYSVLGNISFMLNMGHDSNRSIGEGYLRPEIFYINYFGRLKFKLNYSQKIYDGQAINIVENRITYLLNKKWDLSINQYEVSDNVKTALIRAQKILLMEENKFGIR